LKAIEVEVDNLSWLINDLFELSQIDAGVLELQLETSSLSDLISDTLESMAAQAAAKGRNIHLGGLVCREVAHVLMDPRRVQRVLYNLVQNTIRYTPSDGSVYILARDTGTEVEDEVRDTGEGILAIRERLLGPEHPDTLSSRNNLANGYLALGRNDEAVKLHEETLAIRERVLGPEHPDTLNSRNNLASAYRAAGRDADAKRVESRS
jgi:light-regulated signal transduction histidine kinase (bacteriophytochrome)